MTHRTGAVTGIGVSATVSARPPRAVRKRPSCPPHAMSIHWPIIRRCLAAPGKIAVIDDRRTYRRAEILVGAMHVAAHLAPRCESQTVGLMLPTSGAFPIAALAGWILG